MPSLPPTTSTCPSSIVVAVALTRAVDMAYGNACALPGRGIEYLRKAQRRHAVGAADDEHAAVLESRGGVIDARQRHVAGVHRRSARRVVNLDVERWTVRSRSSRDQHAAVLQHRRGVPRARHGEVAGRRPGAGRRVVGRNASRENAVALAARHQHASVRQRHRGGAGRNGADLSSRDPCAARHLRDVRAQDEPRGTKHGKDQKRDQRCHTRS